MEYAHLAADDQDTIPQLIIEKMAAFERIQRDFMASFGYVQRVHGQRRYTSFPVAATVRYLHALWVCECKDLLLSVPHSASRYDGPRALELLGRWQEGATDEVISFLEFKLDTFSFGQLAQQIQEAEATATTPDEHTVLARLRHGRRVLLNRSLTLFHALDAIFAAAPAKLARKVRLACEWYGHAPAQIAEQQTLLSTSLVRLRKHALLAQVNMRVMNQLGAQVMDTPADRPKDRTARVSPAQQPLPAYADSIIAHHAFTPPPYFAVSNYPIEREAAMTAPQATAPATTERPRR